MFSFKTVEIDTFNYPFNKSFNIRINIITKRKSKLFLVSVLVYLCSKTANSLDLNPSCQPHQIFPLAADELIYFFVSLFEQIASHKLQ